MPNTKQQRNIWHRRNKVCFQHLLVPIKRRSDVELRDGHPSSTLHIHLCWSNWYSLRFFNRKRFIGKLSGLMATRSGRQSSLLRWLKLSYNFLLTGTSESGCGNESLCKQLDYHIIRNRTRCSRCVFLGSCCAYGLTRNALCHRGCLSEWTTTQGFKSNSEVSANFVTTRANG